MLVLDAAAAQPPQPHLLSLRVSVDGTPRRSGADFPGGDRDDAADGGEPVGALLEAEHVEVGGRRHGARAPLVRRRLARRRLTAVVVLVLTMEPDRFSLVISNFSELSMLRNRGGTCNLSMAK